MTMTMFDKKFDDHVARSINAMRDPMYLLKNVDYDTVIKFFVDVISASCLEQINCDKINKGKIEANHKLLEQKQRYKGFGYAFIRGLVAANQKPIAMKLIKEFQSHDYSESEQKSYIQSLFQNDAPSSSPQPSPLNNLDRASNYAPSSSPRPSPSTQSLDFQDRALNDEVLSDQRSKMNRYSPTYKTNETIDFSSSMNDSVTQGSQVSSQDSRVLPTFAVQCTNDARLPPSKLEQSDLAFNISATNTRDDNASLTLSNSDHSSSPIPNDLNGMRLNINPSDAITTDQNNPLLTRQEVDSCTSKDDCREVCQSNTPVIKTIVENTNYYKEEHSQVAEVSPNQNEDISNFSTADYSVNNERYTSDIRSSELCISKSCSNDSHLDVQRQSKDDTIIPNASKSAITVPKKFYEGGGDSENSPILPDKNQDPLSTSSNEKRFSECLEKNNKMNVNGFQAIPPLISQQPTRSPVGSSSDENLSCKPKLADKPDNELSRCDTDPVPPVIITVHQGEEEQPLKAVNTHDESLSSEIKCVEPDEKLCGSDTNSDSSPGNSEVDQEVGRPLLAAVKHNESHQGISSMSAETEDRYVPNNRREHKEKREGICSMFTCCFCNRKRCG